MQFNIPEKQESNIPELPSGTYPAVISGIWDIGIQKSDYQGEISYKHQVLVRFEVSKKIEAEGEYNGKRYAPIAWLTIPKSFSEKANLVKLFAAIFGRAMTPKDLQGLDASTLIGKNLTIATGLTTGGKCKVTGYSPAIDGMPPLVTELESEEPTWVAKIRENGATAGSTGTTPKQPESDVPPVEAYGEPPAPEDDLPF